jgi:hypothetical protein
VFCLNQQVWFGRLFQNKSTVLIGHTPSIRKSKIKFQIKGSKEKKMLTEENEVQRKETEFATNIQHTAEQYCSMNRDLKIWLMKKRVEWFLSCQSMVAKYTEEERESEGNPLKALHPFFTKARIKQVYSYIFRGYDLAHGCPLSTKLKQVLEEMMENNDFNRLKQSEKFSDISEQFQNQEYFCKYFTEKPNEARTDQDMVNDLILAHKTKFALHSLFFVPHSFFS